MATKETKPRPKRAKQGHLNGMEPPVIKEIEAAAFGYVEMRDERMGLTKKETEKSAVLLEMMRRHDLKVYKLPDGRTVEVDDLQKVKVRSPKVDGE